MEMEHDHILEKIRGFCAYQERCTSEVEGKLKAMKADPSEIEKLIGQLVSEGFLNEERFARAFARGKFRNNGWGKVRIRHELEQRRVLPEIISKGLEEIDDEEYEAALGEILIKKNREIREKDAYRRKQKVIAFGMQKGFEYEVVRVVVESVIK